MSGTATDRLLLFVALPGTWGGAFGFALGQVGAPVAAIVFAAGSLAGAAFAKRRNTPILRRFQVLHGSRIILRTTTPHDADAVAATMDDLVLRANGLPRDTPEVHRLVVEGSHPRGEPPDMITIVGVEDGEILGFATFNGLRDDGTPEAGFWLGPDARGRRLGQEVVAGLGQVAQIEGFEQLWLGTNSDNHAMRKSCGTAGAAYVRDEPHRLPNGERITSSWYLLSTLPYGL